MVVASPVSVGSTAPSFEIKSTDGNIVRSKDLRGKVVVMFFGTRSVSGYVNERHLELEEQFKGKDVAVFTVAINPPSFMPDSLLKKLSKTPMLIDRKGKMSHDFGVADEDGDPIGELSIIMINKGWKIKGIYEDDMPDDFSDRINNCLASSGEVIPKKPAVKTPPKKQQAEVVPKPVETPPKEQQAKVIPQKPAVAPPPKKQKVKVVPKPVKIQPREQQAIVPEKPKPEAPPSKELADKYASMEDVSCEKCHGTLEQVAANTTPLFPAGVETAVAKAACETQVFPINPHKSHYGEMKCTQCHKDGETTLYCNTCHDFQVEAQSTMMEISDKSCLQCHETYEKMAEVMTKRFPAHVKMEIQKAGTEKEVFPVNPHKTHYEKMKCTQCHRIHGESRLYCNTCHEFTGIDVP